MNVTTYDAVNMLLDEAIVHGVSPREDAYGVIARAEDHANNQHPYDGAEGISVEIGRGSAGDMYFITFSRLEWEIIRNANGGTSDECDVCGECTADEPCGGWTIPTYDLTVSLGEKSITILPAILRDESCPKCHHPETYARMNFDVNPPSVELIGCRKCGWVDAGAKTVDGARGR